MGARVCSKNPCPMWDGRQNAERATVKRRNQGRRRTETRNGKTQKPATTKNRNQERRKVKARNSKEQKSGIPGKSERRGTVRKGANSTVQQHTCKQDIIYFNRLILI